MHNHYLDWFSPGASKHPVFGKVIDGMDVVEAIAGVDKDGNGFPKGDMPRMTGGIKAVTTS